MLKDLRRWILSKFRTYARICLFAALALSAVIFNSNTVEVSNIVKITVLWVFGVAAITFYIVWSAERRIWLPKSNLIFAAAVFLAACAATTIFSGNPLLSIIGLYDRYGGFISLALYAVIMFVIVGLYWERPGDLKDLVGAGVIGSALGSIYILIQFSGLDWVDWGESSYPVGVMGNSNFAGGYLGIALPFVIYLTIVSNGTIKKLLIGSIGLDLAAIWLTQTRGGMIAAGTGLVTMIFAYRDRIPMWIKAATAVFAGFVIALTALILLPPVFDRPSASLADVSTFRTDTLSIRGYYWVAAWRMFEDHPVVGVGLEGFAINYPEYRLREDSAKYGLTVADKPHNVYLEYLANTGLIGFISYFVLITLGFYHGLRGSRSLRKDPNRFLLVTFLAVFTGYLAQSVFSIDVPPLAVMPWLTLGGIAVIADPRIIRARNFLRDAEKAGSKKKTKESKRSSTIGGFRVAGSGPVRWPSHVFVVVVAVSLLVLGLRPVLADVKANDGAEGQRVGADPNAVAVSFDEAIKLNPLQASYRNFAGAWAERRASSVEHRNIKKRFLKKALVNYRQATELEKGNLQYTLNLVYAQASWSIKIDPSSFPQTERAWRKMVARDPANYQIHHLFASVLEAYGTTAGGDPSALQRSAEELEVAIKLRPDAVKIWIDLARAYRALGDTQRAEAALRQILKLDPKNKEPALF